jgi:hypothetical protein
VSLDDPLDAFIEAVEFSEQTEGKQKAEQFDEKGIDGRKLPWIREILDTLTPALLQEEVFDGPLHFDELSHDNQLAGEKPFYRFALKAQDPGCLAASGKDLH